MRFRGLCPLIVMLIQQHCLVDQGWTLTTPSLGIQDSRWAIASKTTGNIHLGADSLALLTLDPATLERRAREPELLWLRVQKPILHYLTPQQLTTYVKAHAAARIAADWKSAMLNKAGLAKSGESGLLKEIELPVKLPGLLGKVMGGKAGLKVSGRQKISLGGESSYQVGELTDPSRSNSKFPQLQMEQQLRVSLKGNVGDKISVLVDHDSSRQLDAKNKIRIRYEGTEDEILQEIEAGNTSLSLGSGPEFITPSFSHQGLFGIRSTSRMGPATLTMIASKEESQKQTTSFTGQAKLDTIAINDTRYAHNQFFSVIMEPGSEELYFASTTGDSVTSITVYVDDQYQAPGEIQSGTPAVCYLNPQAVQDTSEIFRGTFEVIEEGIENDYIFNPATGVLELRNPLPENHVLAVSYSSVQQGQVGGQSVGGSRIALKLIKPPNAGPTSATWTYELRNVYYLGSRNINSLDFGLKIKRKVPSGEDVEQYGEQTYMNLLGLDDDNDGTINNDLSTVDFARGILFFPLAEPFAADALDTTNAVIYDEKYTRLKPEDNLYYLEASYKLLQSTYSLSPLMVENSEVVRVNGATLTRGEHYDVEFFELRFKPGVITNPDDQISVNYEVRPLFAAGQKTLLGARVELPMGKNTKLGATWMYQGEGGPETTLLPRFGEEPRRAMAADVDGRIEFRPSWLTDAVNRLPFVTTAAPSVVTASAEVAYSIPNPNTKGSAYVDDMEGTRVSTTLPLSFKGWSLASLPEEKSAVHQDTLFYWHNYAYSDPNKVNKGEIYPDSLLTDSRERDDVMEVLNLRIPAVEDAHQDGWVGIQTLIQAGGADLIEREFLEVLVRGDTGVLHVNIGEISEDQIRKAQEANNTLDSEDSNPADGTFIARDEDTGLDGLYSSQESGYNSSANPDPQGDDYEYDETSYEDYAKVNRPEGNRREDTEDLDGNGQLDVSNNYFSYSLPLDGQSIYVEGEYLNGWRLYRIPLEGYEREVGNADLSNVEYCRLWVDGLGQRDDDVWIQIAGIEIVGSNWLSEGIQADEGSPSSNEGLRVKVRNNKENPEYTPPYDPGEDERTGYERREQSLVLAFENLAPDHWGSAYQSFYRDQDYSGYNGIAFWTKPFRVFDDVGRSIHPMVWLRLGANEDNYYEIRLRLSSDEWQKVEVSVDELTRTKVEGRITTPEGFMLSVQGSPSITKVGRMTLGIENPDGRSITGEVWVNDIHLVDVKRERGLARRTSLKVQLADLASVDADYRSLDATYRRLDQRGSTGATSSSTSGRVSTNISLDQFLPDRWGFKLPMSLLWSWQLSRPRLSPGSDVVLTESEQQEKETYDTVNKFSVSLSKAKASRNALVRATLDRIRISYSKSSTKSKGPVRADTTVTERASFDWSWAPSSKSAIHLPLVGFELSYLPSTLSFGLTGQQRSPVMYVAQGDSLVWSPVKFSRTLTENIGAGIQPFKAVSANYSFSATRDLTYRSDSTGEDLLDDETLRNTGDVLPFWKAHEAREMQRTQKVSLQFKPRVSSWFDPSLTYDTTYNENHDPALGAADSIDVRDVSSNTSRRMRATLSLSQLFSKISKGVGERIVLLKGLAKIGSRLQALQGSVGRTESSRFRGLLSRPGFSYQFGLQESPQGAAPYDLSTKDSWDVSGGAQLLKDLRLSARASGTKDRRYFSGAETGSASTTFPDLDLSWSGLHTVGPLKGRVMSSTVRSGYRVTRGDRGKYESGDFVKTGKNTKHDFSPRLSVSLRWKNGLTLTLSDSYSKDENEDLLQAQATTNTRTSRQSSVSLQYAFSAPQGMRLPIFGMMRFKSDLRLSVELSKDRTVDKVGGTPRSDASSWSVRPGASYDFGVVDSGVQFWVSETNNRKLDQRRRNVGLRIWVEFPF